MALLARPPALSDGALPLVRVREEQSGIDTCLLTATEADTPTDRFIFKASECDHDVVLALGLKNQPGVVGHEYVPHASSIWVEDVIAAHGAGVQDA